MNREIKRRTDVVLGEIHDEWQVSDRRYLSEASMALLLKSDPADPGATIEGVPPPAQIAS